MSYKHRNTCVARKIAPQQNWWHPCLDGWRAFWVLGEGGMFTPNIEVINVTSDYCLFYLLVNEHIMISKNSFTNITYAICQYLVITTNITEFICLAAMIKTGAHSHCFQVYLLDFVYLQYSTHWILHHLWYGVISWQQPVTHTYCLQSLRAYGTKLIYCNDNLALP